MLDARELMDRHVEALFTHDAQGDMVAVNEPRGTPAPRFFLGCTSSGTVCRFRYDVDDASRDALRRAAAAASTDWTRSRDGEARIFADILARVEPVARVWAGPVFVVPEHTVESPSAVILTESDAAVLERYLSPWIPDLTLSAPLAAALVDGDAVAVCGSVRRTDEAHEAGVETVREFRGRGLALQATATWAHAVRRLGREPLYSTSWENEQSRAVARKLSLVHFGSDLHLT